MWATDRNFATKQTLSGERATFRALKRGQDTMNIKIVSALARMSGRCAAPLIAAAVIGSAGSAMAQQKAPPAAAPAPGAQAKAAAPAAGGPPASAWVKLCEKAPFIAKDKDGKEQKQERSICLTHHERIDAASGMVLVSAAIRQIEGGDKQHFMIMLPLGMALPPGMQAAIYPADMWDKIQKNEKVDDTKLKPLKLAYTLCHAAGCTGEVEATAEVIGEIKKGAGMIIYAISANGQTVAFPVPLVGFDAALTGAAADNAEYSKQRRALMQQIAENQQKAMEEHKKQNDDLAKMQGNAAHGTAPAAAPAAQPKAAPPAKK
jgi:invasion protein IalB